MLASPSKRQITEWSRLAQKKFRRERGEFLIEGDVCVREAIRAKLAIEAVLVLSSEIEKWERELTQSRLPVYEINSETFERFSKPESSQGIVAIAQTFRLESRSSNIVVACEQVSDPGNCGALIRVADFFGAGELLFGPDSAEIWNPKVVRGSMGSLFHQPIRTEVDLAQVIRDWPGDSVATVAHRGELLRNNPQLKKPILLVLGHETRGLTPEIAALCTQRLTLNPMGHAESLNLVTAAAVFAYALT